MRSLLIRATKWREFGSRLIGVLQR